MSSDAKVEKLTWSDVPVPRSTVSVYEAIHRRRGAWKLKDRAVPREVVQRLLDTAVWAPNHRMTEPWRFVVMEKDSPLRQRLGQLVHDTMLAELDEARAEGYRAKVMDPPVVAYVYSLHGPDEFAAKENYASVVMAIQNMALAGVAEGLAVTLETGRVTRVPGLAGLFEAGDDWDMVGMLAIGYPDEQSVSSRTPVEHFVTWG